MPNQILPSTVRKLFLLSFMLFVSNLIYAQTGVIHGTVKVEDKAIEFASVLLKQTTLGSTTNSKGHFNIHDVPYGKYIITASYIGYKSISDTIIINNKNEEVEIDFHLKESILELDDIVITGTKTIKRKTNSPTIVNILTSETLSNVQACSLSEGLKFQPGLRVETNCQTCNYTQLRINGLAGGYSQILINGRPIFSPLTGLYGLEQLPANMIERIEVVRGGGSSLYGSSAIGGTINVITKVPTDNSYEVNYYYQNMNGKSHDNVLNGNATVLSKNKNTGISFFINHRNRSIYDHNGDDFSEIPEIRVTALGTNLFFLPKENQKLELSLSNINEYRYGGEITDKPAYLAQQSEERTHTVWMGSADYQINFNKENTSFISYAAWQNTKRGHYTGIFPDDSIGIQNHLENPPYGISNVTTAQGGIQLNHRINNFLKGANTFTFGTEYIYDNVFDNIEAYNYEIDQITKNLGVFVQSDWEIIPSLTLLSGVRMDKHNLVDKVIFSPRVSLLYKYRSSTQFRFNYGSGFRAPQAFDTDLHIAFAGGGISRVSLSPDLIPERSQSVSASVNFDKGKENFIAGFTIEGFYTKLNNAFILQPIGEDEFGEQFEKQNGNYAEVKGITIETRVNYNQKVQLEMGFTIQSSKFEDEVEYIEGINGIKEFIRTPKDYGYATLTLNPLKFLNINLNYVYTGKMKIPHFAGAPNQIKDEIITTNSFSELNLKTGFNIPLEKIQSEFEIYGGIKNMFNSYQNDFDIEKNRDSNFVYGTAFPRTFFIGIKLKSM